jgi:D-3-phosphoglycerate dehydrogenase / 2-oxoglutarate reductase
MKIVIPDDYQNAVQGLDCFHKLAGHQVTIYQDSVKEPESLAQRFRGAEALVLIRERTQITESLLSQLPELKLIVQTDKGIAHIDIAACTRHGVAVAVGTGTPYATAELTWGLVLAAMRHIPQEVAHLRTGRWQTTLGLGLHGRTLGIFGYGKIGSLVANYGRAFGMQVQIWGRESSLTRAHTDGFETAISQDAFFRNADILCLHLKLVAETRGIVTATDLAKMKPSALLVNTSRATLIEHGALEEALLSGRPGYAALDVYEVEPATDYPLLHLNNVVCTPHLGFVEKDNYELYFGTAFDQLLAFADGRPIAIVNPQAMEHP